MKIILSITCALMVTCLGSAHCYHCPIQKMCLRSKILMTQVGIEFSNEIWLNTLMVNSRVKFCSATAEMFHYDSNLYIPLCFMLLSQPKPAFFTDYEYWQQFFLMNQLEVYVWQPISHQYIHVNTEVANTSFRVNLVKLT
ncbi:hypothetical protein GmHk_13G036753 [Glycine max]|nr:hypothetical protein GmHk_13G036753 [Glycine max]